MTDNHSKMCMNTAPNCLCTKCANDNLLDPEAEEPCCCVTFQTTKRHCPVTVCRKFKEDSNYGKY